jgi:hypothetical protein
MVGVDAVAGGGLVGLQVRRISDVRLSRCGFAYARRSSSPYGGINPKKFRSSLHRNLR